MEALATLQTLYPTFTRTEKKIADFLLAEADPHYLLNMTLEELSEQVAVGQASILRLAKKCGYTSFRSFLISFQQSHYENSVAARMASRHRNSLLDDVVTQVKLCQENLFKEDLRLAAQCVKNADLVIFGGHGNSAHVAALASARYRRESIMAVNCIPGEIDLAAACDKSGKRMVYMAFSVSGETVETQRVVDRYAAAGACIIAITSYVESTLARKASITFFAPSRPSQFGHSRDLEGIVTPLFVAESILEEYFSLTNEKEES